MLRLWDVRTAVGKTSCHCVSRGPVFSPPFWFSLMTRCYVSYVHFALKLDTIAAVLLIALKRLSERSKTRWTRSTRERKLSLRLVRGVKQSSQAWNSLATCALCPNPENYIFTHVSIKCLLVLKSGNPLAIFNLVGKIPVTRDWLIINVNGLIKAELNFFNSFTEIPSMPEEFLIRKDDKCFRTSFSLTNVAEKDVSIRFFKKLSKDLFEIGLIWFDIFGPTLAKKIMKRITHFFFIFDYFRIYDDFV